jgi:hypothetical protein
MNRTGLLAAVAMMLASSPSYAQFGGMGGMGGGAGGMGGGMGGMGGGMGGMGGGMGGMGGGMAGRGGQGMAGMMGQRGRFFDAGFTEVRRSAQVEMEGGQTLSGKIDIRPVIVDTDLGQYLITPDKIKMVRFLKPVNEVKPVDEAEGNNNGGEGEAEVLVGAVRPNRAAAIRAALGGGGGPQMVADPNSRTGMAVLARGKVITNGDKEIIGMIHIPTDFRLELDFGSLTLAPVKLRSITFTLDQRKDKPANAPAPVPSAPGDVSRPRSDEHTSLPRYFRQGSSIIVISPVGDRITLYNFDTKKSETLELSGSKDAPLEVTPILIEDLVALALRGPKVTRIAVADTGRGIWHSQVLHRPFDGQAVPIVASGVVVYKIGRDVYAYGAEAQRWDVTELPEGFQAMPSVEPGTVTIEDHGHIYTFAGKTGKWDHVDVRAFLDVIGAEKK